MHENIEERINLQKALFEIEDANLFNRYELKQLDEFIEAGAWGCGWLGSGGEVGCAVLKMAHQCGDGGRGMGEWGLWERDAPCPTSSWVTNMPSGPHLLPHTRLLSCGLLCPTGQGSAKDLAEARDRRTDIAAAIRDNDKELAKFKVGWRPAFRALCLLRLECFCAFGVCVWGARWMCCACRPPPSAFKEEQVLHIVMHHTPPPPLGLQAEITSNEAAKRDIQSRIDRLVNSNQNVAFLNLMSTFRLQVGCGRGRGWV